MTRPHAPEIALILSGNPRVRRPQRRSPLGEPPLASSAEHRWDSLAVRMVMAGLTGSGSTVYPDTQVQIQIVHFHHFVSICVNCVNFL